MERLSQSSGDTDVGESIAATQAPICGLGSGANEGVVRQALELRAVNASSRHTERAVGLDKLLECESSL